MVSGCAGTAGTAGTADSAPQAGTNRPSDSPSPVADVESEPSPEPEPSPSPEEDKPLAFGQAFTYTDKFGVSVSAPKPYKPTESATGKDQFKTWVVFTVTIVNGTGKRYDPAPFNTTLQSDSQKARRSSTSVTSAGRRARRCCPAVRRSSGWRTTSRTRRTWCSR